MVCQPRVRTSAWALRHWRYVSPIPRPVSTGGRNDVIQERPVRTGRPRRTPLHYGPHRFQPRSSWASGDQVERMARGAQHKLGVECQIVVGDVSVLPAGPRNLLIRIPMERAYQVCEQSGVPLNIHVFPSWAHDGIRDGLIEAILGSSSFQCALHARNHVLHDVQKIPLQPKTNSIVCAGCAASIVSAWVGPQLERTDSATLRDHANTQSFVCLRAANVG